MTIGTVRPHIEKVKPPRGLICDFPLGRPLGIPSDSVFQKKVLNSLFELLDANEPILAEFPEAVTDVDAEPLVCALPPRMNSEKHPAIDEAEALRSAYDRAIEEHGNQVGVSREIDVDAIPDAIDAFIRVAEGTFWKAAGIPGNPSRVAQDIRGYYQTAALTLAENSPAAWAGEKWFYESTETGKLMMQARKVLKDSDAPQPLWFFLAPMDLPV